MADPSGTQDVVQELHALLREGEEDALQIVLRLVRPEDIAEWLDLLTLEERQRILSALDSEAAGTVLSDTTAAIRAALVDELQPEQLARIAESMPADEAADLLGELELEESEEVLHHIADKDELVLRRLLKYPEDTAGGIMNPEVVALKASATVDHAIQFLRSAEEDTTTAAVYVVDERGRLVGFVRLRSLVIAHPASRLGDIMNADVISVRVDADQEEVADLVDKYDFMAVPVVDENRILVGAVDVDDILDVLTEEATEDIYRLAGSSMEEEESESILHVARYRLPWLLICLAGTYGATLVLEVASQKTPRYQQLSIFIAAIMAMAGNASLQSSTTTVRRLALDTLPRSRFPGHVLREILVALLMGVVCGAVAAAFAYLFPPRDPVIGLALGVAMALGMSGASLFGSAMPLILELVGFDPAVASGPIVTTINDSLVLSVYFAVATGILVWLG